MAKKARDYAAEYAARKAKAARAGYRSEREYKAARRIARRTGSSPDRPTLRETVADLDNALRAEKASRVRREKLLRESRAYARDKAFSATAGKGDNTFAGMSDDKLEAYYNAFPHPSHGFDAARKAGGSELQWLEAYLVGFAGWTTEQFERAYGATK